MAGELMVVSDKNTLMDLMGKAKDSIADILPRHLTAERVLKMALVAASKTPKLYQCTKDSFLKAIMTAAECGLDFSGTTGQGYLIPYGNQVQFIAGYRGLMDMARRSGKVSRLESRIVYANDSFTFAYGINQRLEHQPCMSGERGTIICAYAIARLSDGSVQTEVMTIDEIEAIRKRSKAANNGPWVTDYAEMCRKTVLRRLCKYIPSSPELERVIAADPEVDIIEAGEFLPADTRPKTERLADRLNAAMTEPEQPQSEPEADPGEIPFGNEPEPEPEITQPQAKSAAKGGNGKAKPVTTGGVL